MCLKQNKHGVGLPAAFYNFVFLLLAACNSFGKKTPPTPPVPEPVAAPELQKISIGNFAARSLWMNFGTAQALHPVVILIPGSGPNGPEEAVPASTTLTNKPELLLNSYAQALNLEEVSTLQIGKPGVDYFDALSGTSPSSEKELFTRTTWADLLKNVDNAVAFVKSQPGVDPSRIYLLGHSEGTQVVSDYAETHTEIAGLILLGYAGESIKSILQWQLVTRVLDLFIKPNLDPKSSGFVAKEIASKWPEFKWKWSPLQVSVPISQIEQALQDNPALSSTLQKFEESPLYKNGIFDRPPLYASTAAQKLKLWAYTGELDVQTPPTQALKLKNACEAEHKENCWVHIVPSVGHAFSGPRPPRKHLLLDATLGPPAPEFLQTLRGVAKAL